MNVVEDVMVMGSERPLRSVERDEHLLLAPPHPANLPINLWREHPPLTVERYEAQPFAPPRGIYENDQVRIEWQIMNNRQPFYHRNCDVDEISYQIAGDRTLMTELGVIEHRPGDFSRIPRGVAHDNYGRTESHLLFYLPAPASELTSCVSSSQPTFPPFEGWEAGEVNEAITQCMAPQAMTSSWSPPTNVESSITSTEHGTASRFCVAPTNPGSGGSTPRLSSVLGSP
ncbi:hypothetical protein ACQP1O_16855 [Nocardia sp. CA-151230]|uniref:hypothetical protein n=1 Tax=Nocardia sp. CA-151230 TaxID=3239982 RepID=UPI003D8E16CD